ncbi:keratin, type I cytoskeletal 18-like [Lethenteron reissneri]|uniref:keratin, type I cytoskeletal 18-like n=1 Tax=Lethenteron reissneri TaxID=7753 RepID=UPI002AB677F2|nr:keratin, type I cytoskeletal 18-like [Lethenteron reissneri]XP_061419285.1 keratin, type I cytoskeletal 18-like [Lethenteron reissneri]
MSFSSHSASGSSSPRTATTRSFSSSSRMAPGRRMATIASASSMSSLPTLKGLHGDEKAEMQGLNGRLATYIERVRSLDEANRRTELQIKELVEKRPSGAVELRQYHEAARELRGQILKATMTNARLHVELDNGRLAAEDFRAKLESEVCIHTSVESDITNLRRAIDETNVTRMSLEGQVELLEEQLLHMQKSHADEKSSLLKEIEESSISVEVDSVKGHNLNDIIAEIRAQYEALIKSNLQEMEVWHKSKVDEIHPRISQNSEELGTLRQQLSEQRRAMQALYAEAETLRCTVSSLNEAAQDVEAHSAEGLAGLAGSISRLLSELGSARGDIDRQLREHEALLNTKMRLEEEIETYRRLLEGQHSHCEEQTTVRVTKDEKQKPSKITKKMVKVVTQEIIDGRVVSESSETQDVVLTSSDS